MTALHDVSAIFFRRSLKTGVVVLCGVVLALIPWRTGSAPVETPSAEAIDRELQPVQATDRELQQLISAGTTEKATLPEFKDVSEAVRLFYTGRDYQPAWIIRGQPTPQATRLVSAVQKAQEHGLDPRSYHSDQLASGLAELRNNSSVSRIAEADLMLTFAALRYASALRYGRANPDLASSSELQPNRTAELSELARALASSGADVDAALQAFEPPFLGYQRTKQALRQYLLLQQEEPIDSLKSVATSVKPGDVYEDLPRIAARLQLVGDLSPTEAPVGPRYEGALVDGVKRFQSRHGLPSTGVIDGPTVRAINTPLSKRVEQLRLTLERWRWVDRDILPAIVVNIPEFELRAVDETHEVAVRMHVIVGKAYGHRTPVFEGVLKSVVVRPYWNVPMSIATSEIAGAVRRDPSYVTRHRFEVLGASGGRVSEGDDLASLIRAGRVRVRQRPGAGNALGLLKFDFPNKYGVYLHGTPQQALFSKARRDFSHGCIRIEDPVALATWVLKEDGKWNSERLRNAMDGDGTMTIPVHRKVSVLVVYGTAIVEEDGTVRFFDDVYGHDTELEKKLNRTDASRVN